MPDSLLGLFLFAFFLTPGIAFALAREAMYPRREVSAFRETALTVLVGVLCNLAVLGLFGAIRGVAPEHTPDVGRLITQPKSYIQDQLPYVTGWIVGLLGVSTTLAVMLGTRVSPSLGRVVEGSAWYRMFNNQGDVIVYVGCLLDDGSYIAGDLFSYAEDVKETADRELVLTGNIQHRPSGASDTSSMNVGAAVVSARRIKILTVSYITDAPQA